MSNQHPVYQHAPHKVSGLALRRVVSLDLFENLFFGAATVLVFLFAYVVLRKAENGWASLGYLIPFWAVLAYLALPRLHRVLTAIYVPDYFIGRTRTSDGLLGDPVNLALNGSADQIHEVMRRAGWVQADPVNLSSGMGIVISSLTRRSYPQAPVSPLFLFSNRQAFAYQQEVAGSPSKRHHVRFWPCPPDWLLPGGRRVDWLAAGTYDRAVGLSFFTLQVTHRIDHDIDVERDYIVDSVKHACPEVGVEVIKDFSTGYHSRNGGGDAIRTDGDLPVLDVQQVTAGQREDIPAESDDLLHQVGRRPFSVVAAGLLTAVSLISAVIVAIRELASETFGELLSDPSFAGDPDIQRLALTALIASIVITYLVLAVLSWLTYLGSRIARLTMLGVLSLSLLGSLARWLGSERPPILTLGSLALDMLTIYALTSLSAREWTRDHGLAARRRARRSAKTAAESSSGVA